MTSPRPKPERGVVRSIVTGKALLSNECVLLITLSACDLFITYLLLWRGSQFYEANPLAQWFFVRWNIAGMTAFKFGLVGIIVVLCEVIERHRPRVGRAIVILGCVAALFVSIYGLKLLIGHEA